MKKKVVLVDDIKNIKGKDRLRDDFLDLITNGVLKTHEVEV